MCLDLYADILLGAEMQQNQIRFKNLLRSAGERLIESGMRPQDVEDMLAPAYALQKNSPFWRQQNNGLATFISTDFFRYYRLPLVVHELISVSDRFRLHPLFLLLNGGGQYYILAVSKKSVRFYQAMRDDIIETELKGIPRKLDDTVKFDIPERHLRTRPRAVKGTSSFHGHGEWLDESKDQVIRFLHEIDRGLLAFLKDEQAPLVFAGVDYLFSFYREITSLPNLLEKNISGNPDGLRLDELGKQSWVIAQAFYKKTQDEALAQYWQSVGTGFASTNIAEIIPAAYNGRMGILFSAAGCRQWGKFRPEGNEVILLGKEESRSEDLCDFAAMHTFLNKGLVYEMQPQEMPEGAIMAALFRY